MKKISCVDVIDIIFVMWFPCWFLGIVGDVIHAVFYDIPVGKTGLAREETNREVLVWDGKNEDTFLFASRRVRPDLEKHHKHRGEP